ncbi:MAG TPA: hypothetical protein VFU02_19110 [Polyangiaceae bacterium]|nr:hypothetical protein [Polyangiaceae bacterium]
MMRRVSRVLLACVAVSWSGCVPLTFSREPALDFEVYRHAAVQVSLHGLAGFYDVTSASVYLASGLEEASGFETVSVGDSEAADVLLSVSVNVTEWVDFSGDYPDYEYDSAASFKAIDRNGVVVDSGQVSDSSESPGEAVEDALDEVILHYLRPYRL